MEQYDDDQSVSMEKSPDLAASPPASPPPNKLFVKLKVGGKSLKPAGQLQQHICSVCGRSFSSGKALGGHIRIHMNNNRNRNRKVYNKIHQVNRVKDKKKKTKKLKKKRLFNHLALKDEEDEEEEDNSNEGKVVVSCCICNKGFRSMKSLFGHMRNHPERSWRGIRPPTSDRNSCCSSCSEDDEAAMDEVDQKHSSASGCDLVKALPKWTDYSTNDKPCDDKEVIEAAYALMKLAQGKSLDLGYQTRKYPSVDKTLSSALVTKAPEEKKRSNIVRFHWDRPRERSVPSWPSEEKKKKKVRKPSPMKPDEELEGDPSTMEEEEEEGEYRGAKIIPSSQKQPGFYPKNPSGGEVFEEGLNEADLYSKTLTPPPKAAARHKAIRGKHVCSSKFRDFDLNEPYVSLDGS